MKTYRAQAVYLTKTVSFVVRAFSVAEAEAKARSVATTALAIVIK